jgi:hypothetical protein
VVALRLNSSKFRTFVLPRALITHYNYPGTDFSHRVMLLPRGQPACACPGDRCVMVAHMVAAAYTPKPAVRPTYRFVGGYVSRPDLV